MEDLALKKRSLVLLIKEILDQLNETAELKAKGGSAAVSMLLLREMCSVLRELEPELMELYLEVLPTLASATPPASARRFTEEKAMLSEPVKRRFVERMRDQLVKSAA
ncbi:MAG: hypothetical protein J0M12_12205 [Deltaproteobacteria bacterium]|nr:hypothetical protein [Deltaproteobacteria bacterium]